MKLSVKKQQQKTLEKAQFTTLVMGLFIMLWAFINGSNVAMNNQIKETYLVVLVFSMLVIGFSIISIFSNNNKNK